MRSDQFLVEIFGNYRIEVYPFEKLGFVANFLCEDNKIRGTGFRPDKDTAVSVATSEAVERYAFDVSAASQTYLTDEHPSTCGFAAGLDQNKTKARSILEAFERWCFSQWIDNGKLVPLVTPAILTPLTQALDRKFDKVLRYKKEFSALESGCPFDVSFGVTLYFKGEGVFAGSRVSSTADDVWEHGAVEAWINALNVERNERYKKNIDLDIVERRVLYFSKHVSEAMTQVEKAQDLHWPKASIIFHSAVDAAPAPYHVYRTVYSNFISWVLGPNERFVY